LPAEGNATTLATGGYSNATSSSRKYNSTDSGAGGGTTASAFEHGSSQSDNLIYFTIFSAHFLFAYGQSRTK